MKYNRYIKSVFLIITVIFSLIIVINTIFTNSQTGNDIQGYANWVSPTIVAPGQTNAVLQIFLINTQSFAIYNARIFLSNSQVFTFHYTPIYVNKWNPGNVISFQVLVDVNPNIVQGNYQINIVVSNTTSVFYGSINVPVSGFINFKVYAVWGNQQNPVVPYPGAINLPLTIYIANIGNTIADNVTIYLNSKSPFKFTPDSFDIGVIQANSAVNILTLVSIDPNASVGKYSIPIIIHYFNKNVTYNLSLEITGNLTASVYLLNAYLGENASPMQYATPLYLSLIYISPSPVYLIQIIGELPNGFTNSTGGEEIFYNQPGQGSSGIINAIFLINIGNVSLGKYSIPFIIKLNTINNGIMQEYVRNLTANVYLNGYPVIEISSLNSSLIPGLNHVMIIIKNKGYGNAYNLTITPLPSPQVSVLNLTAVKIPLLRAGESKSFFINLFVPQELQGLTFTLSLNINYISPSLSPVSITLPISFYVSIIQADAYLQIWSESTLIQNQVNNVKIYIKNIGNFNIYNLTLIFNPQNIAILGQNQFIIKTLAPSEIRVINLSIFPPLLSQGVGILQVIAQYFLPSGLFESKTQVITFMINPQELVANPISFTVLPNILTSGNLQVIKLIIKNNADYPLYKISISLNSQTGFINSTLEYISSLFPNQSYVIPLQVLVPSTLNFFSLNIIATYYSNNQNQVQQNLINLPVTGSINFLLTQSSVVQTSVNNTIIISVTPTIVNYGTGTAIGVIAKPVYPAIAIPVINGSVYVGNIAPYTPTTFTISFMINLNSARLLNFTLPITLIYTDSLGRIGNQTIQIPISITLATQTSSLRHSSFQFLTYIPILIIIVIIIIISTIIILKRRRK